MPAAEITYDFNGVKHIRDGHSLRAVAGEESRIFEKLCELERQRNWAAVRDLCEIQIAKTPQWLTPYLCSGVALANLGDEHAAVLRLQYVEKMAPQDANYGAAGRILSQLRQPYRGEPDTKRETS